MLRSISAATLALVMAGPQPHAVVHSKPAPLLPGAVTEDWRSFLGPTLNGVSRETHLVRSWPKRGPRLLWELPKGTGYTSPIISGEYLVYLHRLGDRERVECLHPETGARRWEFSYPTAFEDRYGYNNGPRASPVTDGTLVYTIGAEGKLHALDLRTGQLRWKRDVAAEYKVPQDFFGVASTPLLQGNLLIVNVGAPGGPTVVALDKANGKEIWRAGSEWGPSYASPVSAVIEGRPYVFVFAGGESRPPTGGLMAIDAATGSLRWSFPWRSRSYESVNASSPVVVGNQVFVSASY
ncbi:MAG TPA: PQQ-binding-like beta-propeller repeat protein, partial [Bryobacteraceae bacterium]|nr:PQQ-binding-like beta-propeller repeat protein [Bryobacteraceae bacterium]